MTKQQYEKRLQYFLDLRLTADESSINHMMEMSLYTWSEQSVTLQFPVSDWQLNPIGTMHGGMLATAIDITMGCVSYVFSDSKHTPTVTMDLQYVRPVFTDKPLYIKAVVDHIGSRIMQVRAWGWQEDEQHICISASGSYIVNR